MQVCTSLQTNNHASTPPLSFFTGRMPFLPPNQQRQSTAGTTTAETADNNNNNNYYYYYYYHRHRINKYLDTLLANQPISDGEATDCCQ